MQLRVSAAPRDTPGPRQVNSFRTVLTGTSTFGTVGKKGFSVLQRVAGHPKTLNPAMGPRNLPWTSPGNGRLEDGRRAAGLALWLLGLLTEQTSIRQEDSRLPVSRNLAEESYKTPAPPGQASCVRGLGPLISASRPRGSLILDALGCRLAHHGLSLGSVTGFLIW